MAKTTSVTLRMDAQLKHKAELLFDELGLNMTSAVTVFLKTAVRQGRIPFEISYGKAELAQLAEDLAHEPEHEATSPAEQCRDCGVTPPPPAPQQQESPEEPVWELDL